MKRTVGIVVVFNRNIGNNLTNFALYNCIKDKGYNAIIIDAPGNTPMKMQYKEFGSFSLFDNEDELFSEHYLAYDDICQYTRINDRCDFFIVGSDQLFRNLFIRSTNYYTCLNWVTRKKYKACYGTSTGVDYFENARSDYSYIKKLLWRFDDICLREKAGGAYFKSEYGLMTTQVWDPVFLCSKDYYYRLIDNTNERIPNSKFIASYLLDYDHRKIEIIKKCASCNESEIILLLDADKKYNQKYVENIPCVDKPLIGEWLKAIKDCDVFITDSFHGMCFALIFNKQFFVVFDQDNWRGYQRINEILVELNLTDRVIKDNCLDLENVGKIDYSSVNKLMNEKVLSSDRCLETLMRKGDNYYYCFWERLIKKVKGYVN